MLKTSFFDNLFSLAFQSLTILVKMKSFLAVSTLILLGMVGSSLADNGSEPPKTSDDQRYWGQQQQWGQPTMAPGTDPTMMMMVRKSNWVSH